jgi:protein arginine N-methyltransferase 1
VSDLRASTPFHGAHLPSILDARRRFLAPGGRMVPLEDSLYVSVLRSERIYHRVVEPWREAALGVSMDSIRELAAQRPTRLTVPTLDLCPEPQRWGTLDYREIGGADFRGGAAWEIERPGIGYGLCLWFDSRLSPGSAVSGAPGQPPLPYGQYLLPFSRPVTLPAGDWASVEIEVEWQGETNLWRWTFTRRSGGPEGKIADRLENRSDPPGAASRALQGSFEKR